MNILSRVYYLGVGLSFFALFLDRKIGALWMTGLFLSLIASFLHAVPILSSLCTIVGTIFLIYGTCLFIKIKKIDFSRLKSLILRKKHSIVS